MITLQNYLLQKEFMELKVFLINNLLLLNSYKIKPFYDLKEKHMCKVKRIQIKFKQTNQLKSL